MMLGDLGAQVYKIEPFEGDETRNWGPPFIEKEQNKVSAYFLSVNRNKKSICLNLKDAEGQKLFHEMAKECDVIIENFNVGVTQRLNIDYETIKKINQKIIYASINGYGHKGPLSQYSGFDQIIQASSGLMTITGQGDGPPTKIGIAITDTLTALQTCIGIQAALYNRQYSGEGSLVETSLFESALASLNNVSSNYLNGNFEQTRIGNSHPSIVPYGVFKVKDEYLMLAANSNAHFKILCQIIERQDLPDNSLYHDNKQRVQNRESLTKILEETFSKWNIDNLCDKLNKAKISASKIYSIKEALTSQQAQALQMIQSQESDNLGKISLVRSPLSFDQQIKEDFDSPPLLNQHRDEILQDLLKYDKSQIQDLIKRGILM